MKITRLVLVSLLGVLLVVGFSCGQQQTSENTGRFEIYLAINSSAYDFRDNCSDVGNVALSEEPILSTEDINSYNWSDHCIQLTEDGCHHVATALEEIINYLSTFVVVVNGERIYIGSFVPTVSSYWPDCPSIWYTEGYTCNYSYRSYLKIICISQSLSYLSNASNESDVRSDSRIYQALKQAGKLIE